MELPLVYAPNKVFRQKALPVDTVDDSIRKIIDNMFETMRIEQGIGMGANMVGVLKRIVVVKMQKDDELHTYSMVNPKILDKSKEMQTFEERSLCYPGIVANITRPKSIKISYLDYDGKEQTLDADGFLSTVIQHEMDYLDGKIFLDYLSKMKHDMLIKKMQKHMKNNKPHIHTSACSH